jgi:Mg2+-importing ATPase
MIAIASDNVDEQELKNPKTYNIKEIALIATFLGLISTVFDFMFFALFYKLGPGFLQTNWFIGSILTELALIYSIRTKLKFFKAKRPGWLITCLSIGAAIITIIIPFTAVGYNIFKFISPQFNHLLIIFVIVAAYFALTELVKRKYYSFVNHD